MPKKVERLSIHLVPLSAARAPLDIVDTTFVIKPEEMTMEGELHDDDEPNGTYRAATGYPRSHAELSLMHCRPNVPARLCFSPTLLHDGTLSPEVGFEADAVLLPVDQNQAENRRFGQTFLLESVKTENIAHQRLDYQRPAIPDDDVVLIVNTDAACPPSIGAAQTEATKTNTRVKTKTKSKPVIVSARKTRSATKETTEQAPPVVEKKRQTRKRKPSKSIDRAADTSNGESDDPSPVPAPRITNSKRKTKRRRRSDSSHRRQESSDDDEGIDRGQTKHQHRSRSRRTEHRPTTVIDEQRRDTSKRKTQRSKKSKDQDEIVGDEHSSVAPTAKRKTVRIRTTAVIEKNVKKSKPKKKKTKSSD